MLPATVHLVGAGPGDPDLLTLKAARLIHLADVIVHDRLVGDGILSMVHERCRLIDVGKAPGRHGKNQDQINALLVDLARPDRVTVRLKGGDPFIFGRGGEEAACLMAHGIGVEIVPGITAAAGCAASTGIPLTHRGMASGVRFVTGHCRADLPLDLDWESLADPQTTLVFYMGLAQMEKISSELIGHGLPASTPVAAISAGTTKRQRLVRGSLTCVAQDVVAKCLPSPTLFIIGPVVHALDGIAPVLPAAIKARLHEIVGHA